MTEVRINPEIDPAHIIRAYMWEVLQANDPATWNRSKYGGLEPIVPLGEEPDLSDYPGPHVIYVHNHQPNVGARSNGGMTIVIADNDIRRLGKTLNILRTALDREDATARDINNFSSGKPGFLGIRFGFVKTMFSEGPTPPTTEGGRASATIDLDYEFYANYDIDTLAPIWASE